MCSVLKVLVTCVWHTDISMNPSVDIWLWPISRPKVLSEAFQVDWGEVRPNTLSDPPFPLSCRSTARFGKPISEVLSSYPPKSIKE